jgi:linoleoyl-CoA desaturase
MVAELITPEDRRRGARRYYAKAAFIALWFVGTWAYLVFFATTWWGAALGAVSLAFALGGIGFAIQHDANHGALGRRARWLGYSLDFAGVSSYLWRERHNHAHHTYTNVVDHDGDIDQLPFARFAPTQKVLWVHRFQHIYMWVLYGFYAPKAIFWGDFHAVYSGPANTVPVKRPRGRDLVLFIAGKVVAVSWLLIIPMFFHPWWQVLLVALVALWILGVLLAVVFQLAHCLEEAEFTSGGELREHAAINGPRDWARHQVESTVDFGRSSRVLNWYLGGLNFQTEHHLLPGVCHVHYRRISPHFEALCAQHDIRYSAHPTTWSAIKSHTRWLRRMGQPDAIYTGPRTIPGA